MLFTVILFFFLFLSIFLLFVVSSAFFGFLLTRVPFVPTYASDIKFIVDKLKISSSDVFYDLGSGNGKVVFLVEKLSGAKATGFEMTWWTHLWAVIRLKISARGGSASGGKEKHGQKSRIEFKCEDFFKANWSEANIIYCYLYPPLMAKIQEKFKKEMKPGSIAIVRDFPFPNMAYTDKYFLPKKHEIYVYKV